MTDKNSLETYAAVDLGSNSFHMIVADYADDRIRIIDRIKEMIRLAAGLDRENRLTETSMDTAISCLQRFGQRIREIPAIQVRAVGTNTLRKAKNSAVFLKRANAALGHPIEIIAGREEARLIYQGVTNAVYNQDERRLVVDIGGGSTELIIGRGPDPLLLESLYMGCVNITMNHFPDGEISQKRMRRAILFARQEMENIETAYRRQGWDTAIGSSGSILGIHDILKVQGWSEQGITREGLEKLTNEIVQLGHANELNYAGLAESRRPILAGGVAILSAVFESLGLERMQVSDGALREGLLHDLIGRRHDRDIRDDSIRAMLLRYGVDQEQAGRVRDLAVDFFGRVRERWDLAADPDLKLLSWAALVHEVGISVAHTQHHRHAGYLITNSDLAGFSRQDQQVLALLARAHRRKFPVEDLQTIPAAEQEKVLHLCVLLRLAVLLNRGRSDAPLPRIKVAAEARQLTLGFPAQWIAEHPLTLADLEMEAELLAPMGFSLSLA